MRSGSGAILLGCALWGAPALAVDKVEVLENYSPARAPVAGMPGQFHYASPNYGAYIANVMAGLRSGAEAFGPNGSPTRFEGFSKSTYSIFETTSTPFHSWLGDSSPDGAYANEWGTVVRAAVRVTASDPFTVNDVAYTYADDIGNNITRTFGQLGIPFGGNLQGLTAGGDLLDSPADDLFQPIVALYFSGFANINVFVRQYPADFVASGQTIEDFWRQINRLYVGDPYSFSDSYYLVRSGQVTAIDALAGDIVSGIPEPETWALLVTGFGAVGTILRRRRAAAA